MHQHLHIAARKGETWSSLYTGTDAVAYNDTLEKVCEDDSFDEIKPFPFAQPGMSLFPKQLASARKLARESALQEAQQETKTSQNVLDHQALEAAVHKARHALLTIATAGPEIPDKNATPAQRKALDKKWNEAVDEARVEVAQAEQDLRSHGEAAALKEKIARSESELKNHQAALQQLSKSK